MEGFVYVGVMLLVAAVIALIVVSSLLVVAEPHEVVVLSGKQRTLSNGRTVGYRTIRGGRAVRIPIFEKMSKMDLTTIPVDLHVTGAYSKGGIPLDVQAVANVKISSREGIFANAVERFLDKPNSVIRGIAKENLEGNLRGVLATLTPEEVNEDRLKFANSLMEEADHDLEKLGLDLDTLKIQNVSDSMGYLDSIGKKRNADVIKQARVAEADRKSEADIAEAEARKKAEVARAQAMLTVAEEQNKLRVRKAELEAESLAKEKVSKVSSEQAQVEAEQTLQAQRVILQQKQLQADVVEPARAKREAAEELARAKAATIVADGEAQVAILRMMIDTYVAAGDDARTVFTLQILPELVRQLTETVKGVRIDKISVIDQGGAHNGNGGSGLGSVVNQLPGAVASLTDQIENMTGINILDALKPRSGKGEARPAGTTASGARHSVREAIESEIQKRIKGEA